MCFKLCDPWYPLSHDTSMYSTLSSGRSRFMKGGFSLTKMPCSLIWVEDQKRSSTFILLSQQSSFSHMLHYYCIISNKTTVIRASRFDCSIREFWSDCSIRRSIQTTRIEIYFKGGFRRNLETPLDPHHAPTSSPAQAFGKVMQTGPKGSLVHYSWNIHPRTQLHEHLLCFITENSRSGRNGFPW